MNEEDIRRAAHEYSTDGELYDVSECVSGHINRTYVLTYKTGESLKRYILQTINTSIFKKPEEIMENIVNVTAHLQKKLTAGEDVNRSVLHVIYTRDGNPLYRDGDGRCWRMYDYIEGATAYQSCTGTDMFALVGEAFGDFQKKLADFDVSLLHEAIADFHNTEKRLGALKAAVEADKVGRVASVADEIKFAFDRESDCGYIIRRTAAGILPLRVTHNDTKLNNIMIDDKTGRGLCVIDLDTVMVGSVLYDFGDAIRFGASSAAEDETDLSRVFVRTDMFDAFTRGFIGGLGGSLTDAEILDMPMGAKIITLETGIRFLTDYLDGDNYFRIHYPEHNLDRARNQFKLVADMEAKMPELDGIIQKYLK